MFLPRIIDVMQTGVAGKGQQSKFLEDAYREQRVMLLDLITEAKAYLLDAGSTLFCGSLVKDFEQEQLLMNHTQLPVEVVWVEFDRKELFELESVKGIPVAFKPDPAMEKIGATGMEISLLFDNTDEAELCIYAFRNRGPVIVEPLHVLCVPKDANGVFQYEKKYAQALTGGELTFGTSEAELQEDMSVVMSVLHIPLAFFALMNNPKSGLEIKSKNTEFSAKKIRSKALKGSVVPNVRLPASNTVKLSELGLIHNDAVREEHKGVSSASTGKRASPKRHPVRGHLGWMNGKQFWRGPHYRGVGVGNPNYTKIVDDTSNKGRRKE